MENRVCCCFGHRFVYSPIESLLEQVLIRLITDHGVTTFMSGGMGDFDCKFEKAVRSLKHHFPQLRLILVKPYFTKDINEYGKLYYQLYDDVIIPDELANVHYKAAIGKRNQWMAEQCDYCVAFVRDNFGGAYKAVRYAAKKQKTIYNLAEMIKQSY